MQAIQNKNKQSFFRYIEFFAKGIAFVGLIFFFTSCATIDLRTDYALQNNTKKEEDKGKLLLENAVKTMGYDKFKNVNTYQADVVFKWRMPWTMMPMNSLPGSKNKQIQFKFTTNSFDGQVTYLEGRKKGKTYGLQSWQGYLKEAPNTLKKKDSKRYDWALPTFHYILESPMRILGADIIRYAGETTYENKQYDLVYATWGQDAPHKEHDQWLVYINKETGIIDLSQVTINDFFLPVPNAIKAGTVLFERSLSEVGTQLPDLITIQLGKPKQQKKHVYTLTFSNYQFDNFEDAVLYPFTNIEKIGDSKAIK